MAVHRYRRVQRDHAIAAPFFPVGVNVVSQYQDPRRLYLMHNQESLAAPEVSAPVQGVVTATGVTAVRELRDLVDSFAPPAAITLRLSWSAPGGSLRLGPRPRVATDHPLPDPEPTGRSVDRTRQPGRH